MTSRSILSSLSFLAALGFVAVLSVGCAGAGGFGGGTPPQAAPQTWSVTTGGSSQLEAIQALDYYPNAITVHAGDTVRWNNQTSIPHSVSIPIAGQTPPGGPPDMAPVGGTTFDNSAYISSGFLVKGSSYAVTFTVPGTYRIFCIVHQPEMTGTVVVLPAAATLPTSAQQYAADANADLLIDLQAGSDSLQTFPFVAGGTHIAAGISPGGPPSQASVMRFLDDTTTGSNVTISVGTTIQWTNRSNNVPHSVAFPALGQQPPSGRPDQVPPAGGLTYDGTALANSGVLPPGASYFLTFTKAGVYPYYCLFHDGPTGMVGTVTVR